MLCGAAPASSSSTHRGADFPRPVHTVSQRSLLPSLALSKSRARARGARSHARLLMVLPDRVESPCALSTPDDSAVAGRYRTYDRGVDPAAHGAV